MLSRNAVSEAALYDYYIKGLRDGYVIGYHASPTFWSIQSMFTDGIQVTSGAEALFFYPTYGTFTVGDRSYFIKMKINNVDHFEYFYVDYNGSNKTKTISNLKSPSYGAIMNRECVVFKDYVNIIEIIGWGFIQNRKAVWVHENPVDFDHTKYDQNVFDSGDKELINAWRLDFFIESRSERLKKAITKFSYK